MFGKIWKQLHHRSLTGLIFTIAIPMFASHVHGDCVVGLYPNTELNRSSSRECKALNCGFPCIASESVCYTTASADSVFGEPGSGKDQKWELFYGINSQLNQTCEQWKECCPTCGPLERGKPCQKQSSELKKNKKKIKKGKNKSDIKSK